MVSCPFHCLHNMRFFFLSSLLTKISLIEASSPRDDRENPLLRQC